MNFKLILSLLLLLSISFAFTQWSCDADTWSYLKLDSGTGTTLVDACSANIGDNPAYLGSGSWVGEWWHVACVYNGTDLVGYYEGADEGGMIELMNKSTSGVTLVEHGFVNLIGG